MAKSTKKLINNVDTCVDESIEGFLSLHQGLCILEGHRVILRRDIDNFKNSGKVTTLTGGGSGHEPAFMGYVGVGMMSAAVHGAIFASPSPTPILAALRVLGKQHSEGVIILYNNYTGDRLNFGIAIERARGEGIRVGVLLNACDCALVEGRDKTAGRRGICGLVFIAKIIGAMAEEGKTFDEIMEKGNSLTKKVGTLGVCLTPCSLPGRPAMFQIGPEDLEIGLGLHGEAGVKTVKMLSAKECVAAVLDLMTSSNNKNHLSLPAGSHVAVLLNNLGATTEIEMNILVKETLQNLDSRAIHVDRAYINRFATSLEMSGFHITVLLLEESDTHWLDAETTASAWMSPYLSSTGNQRLKGVHTYQCSKNSDTEEARLRGPSLDSGVCSIVHTALGSGCRALVCAESRLNDLDSASGDGDCGTTFTAGAQAILRCLGSSSEPTLPVSQPASLFMQLAQIVEDSMGGSSGALYSLLFTTAAAVCARESALTFSTVIDVFQATIETLSQYGGANRGDRTMLDPLYAAYDVLKVDGPGNPSKALCAAAKAAESTALETATMEARAGRSSYINPEHLTKPDPGAVAVAIWLNAAIDAIKDRL